MTPIILGIACIGLSIAGLLRKRGEVSLYGLGLPLGACLLLASCL